MDLYLRPVEQKDMQLLFQWANDPTVRKNAYHTEPISLETHQKWFASKLADKACVIYILTDGEQNFGQVRGDISRIAPSKPETEEPLSNHASFIEQVEIDYSIAADYRGLGYGKKMLQLFEAICRENGECPLLYAEVKKENLASQRVFESLDYTKTVQEDIVIYKKRVKICQN